MFTPINQRITDYEVEIGARALKRAKASKDYSVLVPDDGRVFRRIYWVPPEFGDFMALNCLVGEPAAAPEISKSNIQLISSEELPMWASSLDVLDLGHLDFAALHNHLEEVQIDAVVTLQTIYERLFGQVFTLAPTSKLGSSIRFPVNGLRATNLHFVYPGSLMGASESP